MSKGGKTMFYPYAGKELNAGAKAFSFVGSLIGVLAGFVVASFYGLWMLVFSGVNYGINQGISPTWTKLIDMFVPDMLGELMKTVTMDFNPLLCALVAILIGAIVAAVICMIVWFIGKLIWGKK